MSRQFLSFISLNLTLLIGCTQTESTETADLIILNGNVYTLSWPDPDLEGHASDQAPIQENNWLPDGEAVAILNGLVLKVGSNVEVEELSGPNTKVLDADGGFIIPGLVDSHTHVINLGMNLELVDLKGVETEEDAVELIVEAAKNIPSGEWIIGKGWDEGAWASNYPDKKLLSEMVPDHPVVMRSLHSFATWANQRALDKAGIDKNTVSPQGGEVVKDDSGDPTGLFLNKGSDIIEAAVAKPTHEQLKRYFLAGLNEMAHSGYVAIHEAGVNKELVAAVLELDDEGQLPIKVYLMLSGEDEELLNKWKSKGPYRSTSGMLSILTVKAFYDGALGSRGAKLLDDYSDTPGHRGTSGQDYRFKPEILKEMAGAGFQLAVHAIGDAGNRETLDFLEQLITNDPEQKNLRHRIEHAQVLHPQDIPRFGQLNIIASMEPSHAVEDMVWAEDRIGPERINGAYAWRTLRLNKTHIIFNSDLTGTDHNIYYGLHSAITRKNKEEEPEGGWYPDESFSPEEALRSFTNWVAFSVFEEDSSGILTPGRWADISILSLDPLQVGTQSPGLLVDGKIKATIVRGKVVHSNL